MSGPFSRLPLGPQQKSVDLAWYLVQKAEEKELEVGGKRLVQSVGVAVEKGAEGVKERWEEGSRMQL